MANFGTLITEVRRRAVLDTGGAGELTSVKLMINNSVREVQTRRRWNCLYRNTSFPTVSGTSAYTLATRSAPGLLWHEEYGYPSRIPFITDEQWVNGGYNTSTTGKPELAHTTTLGLTSDVRTQTIEFYPIPDDIYTIYDSYFIAHTDMVQDAEYHIFPKEFDELIIMLSVIKGKRFTEKNTDVVQLAAFIDAELRRLARWDSNLTPNFGALRMRTSGRAFDESDGLVHPIP